MSDGNINWREIDYGENGEVEQTQEDVERNIQVVDANIWEKVEATGNKINFVKDVVALYKYMKDPVVSWYRKGIVVSALVYFITPLDLVPDLMPLVGYLDDMGVIVAVMRFLGNELMAYYE